ncbi:MAG: pilus assembly protein [Devosiaceae bacterium]|nr:pilus assembly protein [Devosiaceae bacterium]
MSISSKPVNLLRLFARYRPFRRNKTTGQFKGDENGVTAVEFGLLALPFFAIIGAILETSLIFLASQILDSAVNDSSRLIKTGQAQSADYTSTEYRAAICDGLYEMFDCNNLRIRVSEVASFGAATLSNVVDLTDGSWTIVENYDDGAGASIILVEAYYKWPTMLDILSFDLSNLADGTRMLSAVRVFRNEPF